MVKGRTGSREAELFQGQSKVKTGVVVFANANAEDDIRNVVADFCRHRYVFVLNSCFFPRINASTRSQFYKDETAYLTLENVQYECDENNICRESISRYTKLLEVKYFKNKTMAIKCLCVISPDGKCFTDKVKDVPRDPKIIAQNITRNVTFSCWLCFDWTPESVSVQVLGDQVPGEIEYHFGDFIAVEPEHFDLADHAPWNSLETTLSSSSYMENDIGLALQFAEEPDRAPISDVLAYFVYDNIVYVPSCPNFAIRLAWHKYTKVFDKEVVTSVKNGYPLKVDFQYNHVIKKHVVFSAQIDTSYGAIKADLFSDGVDVQFLIMTLRPIEFCPGFFYCIGTGFDRSPYGVVHDPFGYLAPLYHRQPEDDEIICNTEDIEDVLVRYADPDGCSYTPLYVYSVSQPEITPDALLEEDPMLQLFCLAKGIYYNPGFHNYNIICLEKNIKPGDFCSATFTGYDPDTNTFTVQTIPDQNPKIRHIPAKFSNGRYEVSFLDIY
uniref:Uncharacterized protein n=1 Tax=Panagrolaimus sp. JU765 TaxID=591449 RepID=A0AC34QZH3_9BILA